MLMTDKARTAKALLGDQELIGFVRLKSDGKHMVQRASSAKVFAEPSSIGEPGKVSPVASPRQARKANT
jgi:hypothetical protein